MKKLLYVLIVLLSSETILALSPAPEPNIPVPYDPNMIDANYPIFAYCEAEKDVSQIFRFWACTEHDSHLAPTPSDPNIYIVMTDETGQVVPIVWLRETKFASGTIWVQTIQILWMPATEGIHYYKLELRDQVGEMGRWTLLCNVKASYKQGIYLYPITGSPPIAQQLWQRAKKYAMKPTWPTHVW